jgi:hypothetical protein
VTKRHYLGCRNLGAQPNVHCVARAERATLTNLSAIKSTSAMKNPDGTVTWFFSMNGLIQCAERETSRKVGSSCGGQVSPPPGVPRKHWLEIETKKASPGHDFDLYNFGRRGSKDDYRNLSWVSLHSVSGPGLSDPETSKPKASRGKLFNQNTAMSLTSLNLQPARLVWVVFHLAASCSGESAAFRRAPSKLSRATCTGSAGTAKALPESKPPQHE